MISRRRECFSLKRISFTGERLAGDRWFWLYGTQGSFPGGHRFWLRKTGRSSVPLPNSQTGQFLFFNEVQVFQHAHMVFCLVPFIQLFQPSAWILVTVGAKPGTGLSEQFTICNDAPNTVYRLAWARFPAPVAAVFIPQIGVAYSAIHTAGRYQDRLYHIIEVYSMCSCLLLSRYLVNKRATMSIKEGSSGTCR